MKILRAPRFSPLSKGEEASIWTAAINPHPKSLSQRKRDFESGSPLPKGEEVRETLRRRLVEIDHP